MIRRFFHSLYALVLRTIGIAESRCSYCGKRYGFKYGRNFRGGQMKPFYVSHGICQPCNAIHFPEPQVTGVDYGRSERMDPATGFITDDSPHHQHRSKKNRRRTLGGWGGAAAV